MAISSVEEVAAGRTTPNNVARRPLSIASLSSLSSAESVFRQLPANAVRDDVTMGEGLDGIHRPRQVENNVPESRFHGIEESIEERIKRLGRQRPDVFDSRWAEIGFVFSICMSQVLTVSLSIISISLAEWNVVSACSATRVRAITRKRQKPSFTSSSTVCYFIYTG
jgi:hypothetical protein